MSDYELIDDLYRYNDWANRKLLALSEDLPDRQLDAAYPIGPGSLRATLFHILLAEQIWMQRWTGAPTQSISTEPDGIAIDEIAEGLQEVAARRRSLIEMNRSKRWRDPVAYRDRKRHEHRRNLFDLLLHVANHGVHHRAQALHYLKQFGKSVPGGIDYLFYRLAATTLEQPPESVDALQQFGLAVGTLQTGDPVYDPALADRLFAYHDWANAELMAMCYSIGEAALDKDFAMGPGSIRKAWLHLMDAEAWWMGIWSEQSSAYPHSPEDTPLQSIREQLAELAARRREFLATLNRDSAAGVVTVSPGGPPVSFRISESVVQLALHGTHHRAQIINMIRRAGGKIRDIDLLDWPAVAKATPA